MKIIFNMVQLCHIYFSCINDELYNIYVYEYYYFLMFIINYYT